MKRFISICLVLICCFSAIASAETKIGSTVTFGTYEQDNDLTDGKEPIEWIVLDVQNDDSTVLISKYALDALPYNTGFTSVTWETCSLRTWLNSIFYTAAFTDEEQEQLVITAVKNERNPNYGTKGGSDTLDKVWLLSINEVCDYYAKGQYSYFNTDTLRMCAPTRYAVSRGAEQYRRYTVGGIGTCWWWLRSVGYFSDYAARVDYSGLVDDYGYAVNSEFMAVRPVIAVMFSE